MEGRAWTVPGQQAGSGKRQQASAFQGLRRAGSERGRGGLVGRGPSGRLAGWLEGAGSDEGWWGGDGEWCRGVRLCGGREWCPAELGLGWTGETDLGRGVGVLDGRAAFGAEGRLVGRVWGRNPRWGWGFVGGGPKVGLRASGQPWALGRNPVGIGGGGGRRSMDGMDGMDLIDLIDLIDGWIGPMGRA